MILLPFLKISIQNITSPREYSQAQFGSISSLFTPFINYSNSNDVNDSTSNYLAQIESKSGIHID